MNIFRQLRWKLTLSYTIVTISVFLVVILVLGGLLLTQIFLPTSYFSNEGLVEALQSNGKFWSPILSQSPIDTELIKTLLSNTNATITGVDLLRIGDIQLSVRTLGSFRAVIIGEDNILLGKFDQFFLPDFEVGQPFDTSKIIGLPGPFEAAMAGETDPSRLYTEFKPENRFLLTIPVKSNIVGDEDHVVGAIIIFVDSIPTQRDIPRNILIIAGRFLLFFLLGIGIMGAVFGALIANGLAKRFNRLSSATDQWSEGDFSTFIDDTTGDEIAKFAQRLDNMARQLQSLLLRRQEMAVSEERNRLARDLHDSAKQQALAASFELGTALSLYGQDPDNAKKHLEQAEKLVDSVRQELTDLVHELRPQPLDDEDFSDILKEYMVNWSRRSGIELEITIEGEDYFALETRETLFRIVQEALANIARHSSASHAGLRLEYSKSTVTLSIKDNGHGFDVSAHQNGLGLCTMRERAEAIGGSFNIESVLNQGTEIKVILPVENEMRRHHG